MESDEKRQEVQNRIMAKLVLDEPKLILDEPAKFGQDRNAFFEDVYADPKRLKGFLPIDEEQALNKLLEITQQTPEEVADLMFFSEQFGQLPERIQPYIKEIIKYTGDFTPSKATQQERGIFSKIAESWRRGDAEISADIAAYEALFEGRGSYDEVKRIRKKLQLQEYLDPIDGNFFADMVYGSARILPGMLKGYWSAIDKAFEGMAIGAGMAYVAGQVPPLTLAPEEIVGIPAGALVGGKAGLMIGASMFWYKQGAGAMASAMIEKGYDPYVSMEVAGIAAIPYAMVEMLQVWQLTPGLRRAILKTTTKNVLAAMARVAARYGGTLTVEVLEEVVQEIIQIGAEDISGVLSDVGIKVDAEYFTERGRRVWETLKEAGKSMALLPIPGAAIDMYSGLRTVKEVEVPPEVVEKPPEVVPEVEKAIEVAKVPPIPEIEAMGDKELKEKFLSARPASPEWVAAFQEMKRRKVEPEAVKPPVEKIKSLLAEEKQLRDEINRNMGEGINILFTEWPNIGKELGISRNELAERGAAFVSNILSSVAIDARKAGRSNVANKLNPVRVKHERLVAELDINQDRLAKLEAQPPVIVEPEVVVEPAPVAEATKLRQKIHAVAAVKGLTKKALTELKKKHTGYSKLTGKIAVKKITTEQLRVLLKAVQKARPKRIGYKRVITPKTEKKIQSLKENLIKKAQMTEKHFKDILEKEVHGKEPRYIDAKKFITETEGKDIIKRTLDEAEIIRLTESFERAIAENPEIAEQVKSLDSRIKKSPKRDPYSIESMRYYNQQAQIKTGVPIFTSYMDLMDTHLEITKTRTAIWARLKRGITGFKEIAKDEEALQRISDYIASQSVLEERPAMPTDITVNEIKLAQEIQKIFVDYQLPARFTRFYWWWNTGKQEGPHPLPDYDRYKTEINKAVDIYESKGRDELEEYLKTQEWGIIKSGYEPLDIITHKIQPYITKAKAVGKGHIKIRTDIEYHMQERNILQRLSAYMRQIDMLYNLSPKINAYIRLWDDNATKFKEWGKVKNDVEIFIRNLKKYNIEGGFFGRTIARAYSQAMRVIIMPSPVLSFRNTFQNAAFEHDKSILIDPRNEKLSNKDIEYLETYILQTRAMVEEYFMVGEKPLPGLKVLTRIIDKIKIYPYSDIANRHWSFWAKTNQVNRALKADAIKQMMKEAKFEDMTELEQRRALGILARDGEEAMTQYIGRVHVDDIHFLYERSQRSPAEMTSLGRVVGNLMLFPRAYGEKLAHAANKMLKGKTYEEQWRGLKIVFAVVGGGMIAGSVYMMVTGRKRNPYNPLEVLAFRPGGLAWGSIEAATEIYANILSAAKGDSRALAALTIAIPRAADMFIPFYDYTLRAIEVATDQKNIDRRALREMRMMIDKQYKIRGGAYKVKRTALEKWQYFISGPGVEKEEKKKPKKITW